MLWLGRAVDTRSMWGQLARPLGLLIQNRIRDIKLRFARLAARVAAGTYVPRRPATAPRKPTVRGPRTPNPLPHRAAWLLGLVPDAAGYRAQLETLFRDACQATPGIDPLATSGTDPPTVVVKCLRQSRP
jgi:hypothetical protein